MSISLSPGVHIARMNVSRVVSHTARSVSIPARFRDLLAEMHRRHEEREVALAIADLGHPGVMSDFERAARH